MTTPDVSLLPTRRIRVTNTDNAVDEIRAFLAGLAANGERPWAEVFYPPPASLVPGLAHEAWEIEQGDAYDAIELIDGELVTLPPYVEIIEGAAS